MLWEEEIMDSRYEIRPVVTTILGIPVMRYGIFNTAAGICGRWVEDNDTEGIWLAPRWILRRWIRLQEKAGGKEI
jgi:hypothetical protein